MHDKMGEIKKRKRYNNSQNKQGKIQEISAKNKKLDKRAKKLPPKKY